MRLVALALAGLVLASPAAAADREVRFGDAFRLEAADPGPFDRLADGRLACLSDACAGRTISVGGIIVRVVARVTSGQVRAARAPYRAPAALAARPGAGRVPGLLFLLAACFALLALGLALAGLRHRRDDAPVDRLRRALRLVRDSAAREPGDRRRALDLLAAALGEAPLAERASRLAWSRPAPEPDATRAMADEVAG